MRPHLKVVVLLGTAHAFVAFSTRRARTSGRLATLADTLAEDDDRARAAALAAIAGACARIADQVRHAPIDGLVGKAGTTNAQGEEQIPLDVAANAAMVDALAQCGAVAALASEEEPEPLALPHAGAAPVAVAFDPLDGSSNVDCAIPTGTIFGVYRAAADGDPAAAFAQPGDKLIAAGYAMYSASTELVLATDALARPRGFTLDARARDGGGGAAAFVETRRAIECPRHGPYYSLNEGRSGDWPEGLRRYVDDVKNGRGRASRRYSSRYVCSLVADVHRTLLYGGWAGNPRAHLRLLYEAAPLGFVAERAGGAASDGLRAISSIVPESPHMRLPVFIGSADDIAEIDSYGDVQQVGQFSYAA